MDLFIAALLFFAYSMILLIFGKHGFGDFTSVRKFFIADGKLKLPLLIVTFAATWVSSTTVLGLTGRFYATGWQPLLFIVGSWFVGALLLLPLVKRIRSYDIVTVPEFFYKRYHSRLLQFLGGLVVIIAYLFYITIQIYGFGLVTTHLLDIPYYLSILIIFLFLLYTSFGGFVSVARTDLAQLVLTGVAILIAGFFVMKNLNAANIQVSMDMLRHVTMDEGLFYLVMMSWIWMMGKTSNPQYLVRIMAAESDRAAKKMIVYSLVILLVLYLILWFVGVGISFLLPDYSGASEELFLVAIQQLAASPWGAVILIGVMASAVSTANSQLLIVTGSFLVDLFPYLSRQKQVRFHRMILFMSALIAVLIAVEKPDSILNHVIYIWGFLAMTFFWPLYGGLFWKKVGCRTVLISILGGWTVTSVADLMNWGLHPVWWGMLAATVLFFLAGLFERGEGRDPLF
ncbi:MAG: sodium:solute symporter family protein [Bacillaceae bacterium]|nr:sodium:solute symporter family protein [Bacillaceae bacterium]